jgi:hypothetical protein
MDPYYRDKSVQGILFGKLRSQKSVRVLFLSVRNMELLQKALELQPSDLQAKSITPFFVREPSEDYGKKLGEEDDPEVLWHFLFGRLLYLVS